MLKQTQERMSWQTGPKPEAPRFRAAGKYTIADVAYVLDAGSKQAAHALLKRHGVSARKFRAICKLVEVRARSSRTPWTPGRVRARLSSRLEELRSVIDAHTDGLLHTWLTDVNDHELHHRIFSAVAMVLNKQPVAWIGETIFLAAARVRQVDHLVRLLYVDEQRELLKQVQQAGGMTPEEIEEFDAPIKFSRKDVGRIIARGRTWIPEDHFYSGFVIWERA